MFTLTFAPSTATLRMLFVSAKVRLVFGSIKPLSAVSIWARSRLIETPGNAFCSSGSNVPHAKYEIERNCCITLRRSTVRCTIRRCHDSGTHRYNRLNPWPYCSGSRYDAPEDPTGTRLAVGLALSELVSWRMNK